MGNPTIRIGIVGAGANSISRHLPGLLEQTDVKITSVCNRSRSSSERVAQKFDIDRVYDSWPELVQADDSDAIVIGTWPYLHCPITLAAISSGKHVLCEARMSMNASEARMMLLASRNNPHLVTQVVPAPHTLGEDKTIQRLISEDAIGDIFCVELIDSGDFQNRGPIHWRHNRELSGLNMMTMGIWYEALMRWVGPATKVTALSRSFTSMRPNDLGVMKAVSVPDYIDVLGNLACGGQLRLSVSQVTGLRPSGVWICGSEGTIHRDSDGKLYYGNRKAKSLSSVPIAPQEKGYWRVEEEFINTIRGKEEISHTRFTDGVQYMEFTSAVHRSLQTRTIEAIRGL